MNFESERDTHFLYTHLQTRRAAPRACVDDSEVRTPEGCLKSLCGHKAHVFAALGKAMLVALAAHEHVAQARARHLAIICNQYM